MSDEFEILGFEYDRKGKSKGLRWDVSPMMKAKFLQRAARNPSFFRVFNPNFNLSMPFFKEVKYRTSGERNLIVEITGSTGSGKSLLSLTLGVTIMGKPVVADDICFTTDELLQRAMKIGKSHVLVQDEQINQLGAGSQREAYERQTLEDTTRKFGLSIIFCSPTTREHSTAHYNLEIICRNSKKRLTKVAILGDHGIYLGYFVLKVLPESNKLWKEYNERKDAFIESVLNRSTNRLSVDDMSRELVKHKMYKFAKTKEQKKVVAVKVFPTLATNEINMIVENLGLLEAMGGLENEDSV